MALTSASDLDDALNQLNDNLNYEQGGLATAINYREALRWLKHNRPELKGDATAQLQFESIEEDLKQVAEFIRARDTTNRARFTTGKPQ